MNGLVKMIEGFEADRLNRERDRELNRDRDRENDRGEMMALLEKIARNQNVSRENAHASPPDRALDRKASGDRQKLVDPRNFRAAVPQARVETVRKSFNYFIQACTVNCVPIPTQK